MKETVTFKAAYLPSEPGCSGVGVRLTEEHHSYLEDEILRNLAISMLSEFGLDDVDESEIRVGLWTEWAK